MRERLPKQSNDKSLNGDWKWTRDQRLAELGGKSCGRLIFEQETEIRNVAATGKIGSNGKGLANRTVNATGARGEENATGTK